MSKDPEAPDSSSSPARKCWTLASMAQVRWPTVATLAILVVTAAQLRWQGRQWWCACGQWYLWTSDAWGPHNSQHLLDPYSLTHVLHGLLLCGILAVALPQFALRWRFVLAVVIESGWEILENSAFVINRYRAATASQGYLGDTIANSMGDILSCAVGFWLASRLGWRRSLVLFVAIEVLLLVWIRDSLLLNIVMLAYPLEIVRRWQTGG